MKLIFKESTKKVVGLSLLSGLLICLTLVIVKFNSERKWVAKDDYIKVEEVGRFSDGDDTTVIIKIFYSNNEYVTTYTKKRK
jgi:hypothetical protein